MADTDQDEDVVAAPLAVDVPANAGARPSAEETDRGSFLLGVLMGVVGGLLLVALVYRRSKPSTRSGILWGAGLQILVVAICLRGVSPTTLAR